jgi:hypothetical protein
MAVGFLAPQRHEHAVPLHTARVIRDAFHCAIMSADDLAHRKAAEKRFELHTNSICRRNGLNG